ncbi:hypothetical protein ASE92_15820 [Pedobacter sp. Leaf41]|uniref:acetyltransferase n=1 Tax=Pedobacter sp. Leaf41 TaxID=1736218 RepID=UPI00070318F0|nr:acetyltransferase [Pedobacter sp. Leaf41]KQN34091.1 hypothetical protein ASE92_15820 [Pedobacter sp. Leaf41]
MKTLAIIGAGHLGQQIAHLALNDKHYGKIVFFDDIILDDVVNGHPVIGKTSDVIQAFSSQLFDELIIGIGYKHLQVRKSFFEKFKGQIPFGKIVHSSSYLDCTTIVKPGCIIYPKCILDANVTIESNTILNLATTISHDSVIGENCFLSPRVAIAGFVNVGDMCILGINSTVIDNLSITSQTQIGGAGLVIKNIERAGLYVGNPVRFIREKI